MWHIWCSRKETRLKQECRNLIFHQSSVWFNKWRNKKTCARARKHSLSLCLFWGCIESSFFSRWIHTSRALSSFRLQKSKEALQNGLSLQWTNFTQNRSPPLFCSNKVNSMMTLSPSVLKDLGESLPKIELCFLKVACPFWSRYLGIQLLVLQGKETQGSSSCTSWSAASSSTPYQRKKFSKSSI
jgi:hypothetical protein